MHDALHHPHGHEERDGLGDEPARDLLAIARGLRGIFLAAVAALGINEPSHAAQPAATLKLATWNLEWLIAPREFARLRDNCTPPNSSVRGNERRLPCDVVRSRERATSDFNALARYATELDADVIALQEVDGAAAAKLVFREHDFCFTSRKHVQNTGFAIRRNIPHRCEADVTSLALGGALRPGVVVTLFPGDARELTLLGVHLKSGCDNAPLTNGRKACRDLARQTPLLEAWIDAQAAKGKRFAILGDFNRRLASDGAKARSPDGRLVSLWAEIDDGDPPEADLVDTGEGQRFVNCSPGRAYSSYIDYIVLSRSLGTQVVPGSFERLTYTPADAHRLKLSDHCPVAIEIALHARNH